MARRRGTRNLINPSIDSKWFEDTLRDLKISVRGYAKRPEVNSSHSQISRMFRGRRRFTSDDIETFANITGRSREEVVRHATGSTEVESAKSLTIVGWVDEKRRVHVEGIRAPKKVTMPPDVGSRCIALRYQTAGTVLSSIDGAVIYCRPLGILEPEMLGRWCCVKIKGGGRLVRVLKKGRSGKFDLIDYDAGSKMERIEIESAALIEWAKF